MTDSEAALNTSNNVDNRSIVSRTTVDCECNDHVTDQRFRLMQNAAKSGRMREAEHEFEIVLSSTFSKSGFACF